tara:strand:+ start:2307 stop:2480 length:174 start_codon:yes stop_codon:yes gene_type:complete
MDSIERYDERVKNEKIQDLHTKIVKIEEHMERMLDCMELIELRISDLKIGDKEGGFF